MSRCFPFPPPGYEKKTRTDDFDLLKKEKRREKKHKKEKKDKEKRESKEKREKEGRDGKHKEKKDKKEKHREKKKDKDKDRDKDKSKISAAVEIPGHGQGPNAGKQHQKEIKQNDKKGALFDDKLTKQYAGNNGEKARENNHLAEESKDSKFLLELDRRIRDNDGGVGNQLVQKFTIADHRKDEGAVRLAAKGSGTWPDGNEKLQDKGNEIWTEAQHIGKETVQNHANNFHLRVGEMPRPLEQNFDGTLEATVEGKERVKDKKDDKRGNKRKDREKEKKGHGKEKDKDKEKKKKEKAKERTEHENREQNKLKESNKVGPTGSNSLIQVLRHSHGNSIVEENPKKRKDIESNGVMHVDDNRISKLPRPSSSHPCTENGRILEPCQISLLNASHSIGAATNVKADNKERKINGIIEALPSAVSSDKTSTATVPADAVTEAYAKPPHPDTKYLSQVYLVPKADEWSDFDDQEWLFGSSSTEEKKPVLKSSEVGDTLQVWAEAVHIEAADIFALPYVIPY
ncbi:uncharacterized protein LOC133312032 [Gastrolobium bilobum]|uniref:uncharacterized protein LOC133312032 n=1 Tax=Gastrolobium bilobum TaxID=150636 RepID=UPI002AB096CB|nr:uncharacterized protein LOC133312032 [Gastrolobium bilobum]XP_061369153.1 uncharacterized protein LOC133312032 [Gastrolobium bilobum]